MERILLITPYCPYPPYKSGGINTIFNILKENKDKEDRIDLFYFDERDTSAEIEINKYVDNIMYKNLRKKANIVLRVKSILEGIPYGIYQYDKSLLSIRTTYDKVIFDQPLSINLVDKIEAKEKILIAHDSMILYFNRKSEMNKKNIISNIYNRVQSKLYLKLEKKQLNKFNKIIFVSRNDANYEASLISGIEKKVDTINLGVDYNKFNSENYNKNNDKSIIFTGIMSYAPNKDAAMYFAKEVFPQLLKIHNDLKFYIVGKDPDEEIKKLQSNNIIVTGFVDDVVKYVAESTVYVSPLRFGTGMKNKILEAMSTSKAIVASDISLEGINELKHEENVLIANTTEEWIKYVDLLLKDKELREKLSSKGRQIIIEKYSWKKAFAKIVH